MVEGLAGPFPADWYLFPAHTAPDSGWMRETHPVGPLSSSRPEPEGCSLPPGRTHPCPVWGLPVPL